MERSPPRQQCLTPPATPGPLVAGGLDVAMPHNLVGRCFGGSTAGG